MNKIIENAKSLYSLQNYDFRKVEGHEGGRNQLFICSKDGAQKFVLRVSATGDRTENDYIAETEFVHFLAENGAKGLSTFMSYYILKCMAEGGKKTEAFNIMKDYYGAMLDLGATTFWEDFDIKWAENSCRIDEFPKTNEKEIHGDFGKFCYKGYRHSLCHGWSSGIIRFIKEECR